MVPVQRRERGLGAPGTPGRGQRVRLSLSAGAGGKVVALEIQGRAIGPISREETSIASNEFQERMCER